MTPIIGITSYAQEASWGAWKLPAAVLPLAYVESVVAAGGRPVLLAPVGGGSAETLGNPDGVRPSGAALDRTLPVLAVCRGMQLLNVVHGGGLHQHLPELVGHEGHREVLGAFSVHVVRLEP